LKRDRRIAQISNVPQFTICRATSLRFNERRCLSTSVCRGSLVRILFFAPPREDKDVLVLSRKVGERILIGEKIAVTVVKIGHGGVRIGIDAPTELAVVREELAKELERTERALASEEASIVAE
jgi:carbon storage regulator